MKKKVLVGLLAVIMCFAVVGCGKKDEETNNDNSTNNNGTNTQETTSNNGNDDYVFSFYSDDTKLVYESETSRFVFFYSGEKITGYHLYVSYETPELAAYALKAINADNDDTIKKAYTKGKYLVVEYSESEYSDLTVDDVRIAYQSMTEIKK